jgi:hypothetical protein
MRRIPRRAMLASLGLTTIALPFLRSLPSSAGPIAFPKRLIVFATPNGTVMDNYWPGTACSYGPILEPLTSLKSKLLVMRGLDYQSAGKDPVPKDHYPDNYNMLIARQPAGGGDDFGPGGISIDQHIAQQIGDQTKYATQHSGVQTGGYCGIISALDVNAPVGPENDPFKVFDRFFADFTKSPGEIEKLRAEKKSILDTLDGELGDLRCRLGSDDRQKLDVHIDSIREIEKQLDFNTSLDACDIPDVGDPFNLGANDSYPAVGKLQMDLLVAGMACDLTRIATLQWRHGNGDPLLYNWLDGVPYTQHDIAHANIAITPEEQADMLTKIDRWYAEQFAYLCQKLDAIQEGDGTMLDNCAVLWTHEQSNGGSHQRTDQPWVIAGGCGGAIKTGRCVDFGGKSHSGLLMALAYAMGVPTDEFGDPDFSVGPIDLS